MNATDASTRPQLDPANPYPYYAWLRTEEPVHHAPNGVIILSRYRDIAATLKDSARFGRGEAEKSFQRMWGLGDDPPYVLPMHFRDPPDHTRLRGLVSKAFTPRMIAQLKPQIVEIVDSLLDKVQHRGEMDLVGDLSYPLPITIICRMLGIPAEDHERVREMSTLHTQALVPNDKEIVRRANEARKGMAEYFRGLVAQRRRDPKDDLITALSAAEEAGDKLNEYDLIATLIGMTFAGHETTANGLSNGVYHLLRNPSELERLRRNPEDMDSAIEEMLRFEPPVPFANRVAKLDVEIAGVPIKGGTLIRMPLAAGNRDPEAFPDPERFDIGRTPNKHLAWGGGIHFCLGAALARLQISVAIETLLRRMPKLALASEEIQWRPGAMRGPKVLALRF